jgi:endonuclease YncB( thermonuclease family)
LGTDGHFVRYEGLSCSDHAEAIKQAERLAANQDIELWSGDRFIVALTYKRRPPK